jgi:hypothetical protein
MKLQVFLVAVAAALLSVASAQRDCPRYPYKIHIDTAHDAEGLKRVVGEFQSALGGGNNMDLPGQSGGFRAINWDGAKLPFDMPPAAFKKNRGAEFFSSDNKFVVSNPNNSVDGVPKGDPTAPPKDIRFSSLDYEASKRFQVFSPNRLFTVRNSNEMSAKFFKPAQSDVQEPAAVGGFGAVFTDVDLSRSTSLEFYDRRGCFIAKVYVPPRSKGLSFASIVVDKAYGYPIYEVKFKVGTKAISSKYSRGDVVVMDDFIFGEPKPFERK